MKEHFSEDQLDALTELVNIGVSGAASRFSRMVRGPVKLSVPAVGVVSPEQAAGLFKSWSPEPTFAVEQDFSGAISGHAMLLFPREQCDALFRAVSADAVVPDGERDELVPDALRETGNVLLQGCLGAISNLLQAPLTMSVPTLVTGPADALVRPAAEGVVIVVYVNFDVEGRSIRGYIALVLDLPSVDALRGLITDFIKSVS